MKPLAIISEGPHGDGLFLRQLFAFSKAKVRKPEIRSVLLRELEARIARVNAKLRISADQSEPAARRGYPNFGQKGARELAEVFVNEFGQMKIATKTLRSFLIQVRNEGYRSRVRGKLFHLFVRNFAPLQKDFLDSAMAQVNELNEPVLAGTFPEGVTRTVPNWLNAQGDEVVYPVKFDAPRQAERVCIRKMNGNVVEFVDDAYVSCAAAPEAILWTFLCEIEVKTAGAARGFGKQIGFSQSRFGARDVKEIEMQVDGFPQPVRVSPKHIIFSQRSIDRNAVTFLSKGAWERMAENERSSLKRAFEEGDMDEIYARSDFRFQSTALGHGDAFRRTTLAVYPAFMDAYVDAIWPPVVRQPSEL